MCEQVLELRDEKQYAEVRNAGIHFGALGHRLLSSIFFSLLPMRTCTLPFQRQWSEHIVYKDLLQNNFAPQRNVFNQSHTSNQTPSMRSSIATARLAPFDGGYSSSCSPFSARLLSCGAVMSCRRQGCTVLILSDSFFSFPLSAPWPAA